MIYSIHAHLYTEMGLASIRIPEDAEYQCKIPCKHGGNYAKVHFDGCDDSFNFKFIEHVSIERSVEIIGNKVNLLEASDSFPINYIESLKEILACAKYLIDTGHGKTAVWIIEEVKGE